MGNKKETRHKGSRNKFINDYEVTQDYVINKDWENIWDDTTAPESEDAKRDGNNASENTQPSGSMAIWTLDTDDMKQTVGTVGSETGPTRNAHHVLYQTRE